MQRLLRRQSSLVIEVFGKLEPKAAADDWEIMPMPSEGELRTYLHFSLINRHATM